MTKLEELRTAIEHAPKDPGQIADGLKGWVSKELEVCASCVGRIHGRGCGYLLNGFTPEWDREVACCLCKCQSCGVRGCTERHPCPYQEELYGDSETLCNCCDDCAHECALDI